MHVAVQLARSMSEKIKDGVSLLEGRAYINGAPGWDRRSYPVALVAIGRTKTTTHLTGTGARTGRLQSRLCEVVVEFSGLVPGQDAPARLEAQLAQIASDVEIALAGFAGVPVSDIGLVSDSGLEDVTTTDQRGLMGSRALTYAVSFHTVEGNPNAFYAPQQF